VQETSQSLGGFWTFGRRIARASGQLGERGKYEHVDSRIPESSKQAITSPIVDLAAWLQREGDKQGSQLVLHAVG